MFCGLDLGTTNIKAMLVDENGRVVARSSCPIALTHTADGGVEQDLDDIRQATVAALRRLGTPEQRGSVEAVGVSSQGGAMQITDSDGRPVGPVISWLDARGREYDERLTSRLGRDWFIEHLGHGRSNVCLGQLLRLREQAPHLLAKPNRVGFVGDLIVSRLCGRAAHDATSLSLAWLYNPSLHAADPETLALAGIRASQLPHLLGADIPAGRLLDEVAAETLLPANIPVSPAVHDQYASALGAGSVNRGDITVGTGTAWAILAACDRLLPPVRPEAIVCPHLVDGLFGQMFAMVNGGSAFAWVRETVGLAGRDAAEIDAVMAGVPAGSDGLLCVPAFASGGGAEQGGAKFAGIRISHGPEHLLRAVIEGLACDLNRHVDFLRDGGIPVERLVLTGRAAGSSVTPQVIADVTGLPLVCCREFDTSAFGASVLARSLIEQRRDLAAIASDLTAAADPLVPSNDRESYRKLYAGFMDMREALS